MKCERCGAVIIGTTRIKIYEPYREEDTYEYRYCGKCIDEALDGLSKPQSPPRRMTRAEMALDCGGYPLAFCDPALKYDSDSEIAVWKRNDAGALFIHTHEGFRRPLLVVGMGQWAERGLEEVTE